MDKNKKIAFYIMVAISLIIILIVGTLGTFYIWGKATTKDYGNLPLYPTDSTASTSATVGIEKGSVLRSDDSGVSFKDYFKVATSAELGVVDVLGVHFYPKNDSKIIVSTYGDGFYLNEKTENIWQPITFNNQKIFSFIIDNTPNSNRIFASSMVSDNGRVFRTDNGGKDWRAVYTEPGTGTYVSALTQYPINTNTILAGTNTGTLVRSLDGGETWKNIGQKISGNIASFEHDSTKESFTYLLMSKGKIYHSYDAGVTWVDWEVEKPNEIKRLNNQATQLSRTGDKEGAKNLKDKIKLIQERNRTEKRPPGIIFIKPDPNTSGVLYAGGPKGLYRSTDYGKYWQRINIIESAEKFPITSIAINPFDSNEISFIAGNAFYRSVNYGSTWSVTPIDRNNNISFLSYSPYETGVIFLGLSSKE